MDIFTVHWTETDEWFFVHWVNFFFLFSNIYYETLHEFDNNYIWKKAHDKSKFIKKKKTSHLIYEKCTYYHYCGRFIIEQKPKRWWSNTFSSNLIVNAFNWFDLTIISSLLNLLMLNSTPLRLLKHHKL